MKKIVVLSGAGISAESGLRTFRDSDGLWEGHDVTEVASPEGWYKNPELVLNFYNERRKQALKAEPNAGHLALADLEKNFEVNIITQNVDLLHEQAGSSNVLHLHGQLFQSRSTIDPGLIYPIKGWSLDLGDLCERGAQLRPDIVWFGEAVPAMEDAVQIVRKADFFIVVGTSLVVYPAAGLVDFVPHGVPIYLVDPNLPQIDSARKIHAFQEPASTGLLKVSNLIKEE